MFCCFDPLVFIIDVQIISSLATSILYKLALCLWTKPQSSLVLPFGCKTVQVSLARVAQGIFLGSAGLPVGNGLCRESGAYCYWVFASRPFQWTELHMCFELCRLYVLAFVIC